MIQILKQRVKKEDTYESTAKYNETDNQCTLKGTPHSSPENICRVAVVPTLARMKQQRHFGDFLAHFTQRRGCLHSLKLCKGNARVLVHLVDAKGVAVSRGF